MKQYIILWNPQAGNGRAIAEIETLKALLKDESLSFYDMTKLESYDEIIANLQPDDILLLCGGDGTLNRFVNDTADKEIANPIYYYASGSGNDFLRDIPHEDEKPIDITAYLQNLPTVTVNDKTYHFINGVGYGIDGYCCEVGDLQRQSSGGKPVNYTAIAIKGLLFHYHPTTATITVDGVTRVFRKAWLAPTMHGRYYGGGMMPTPGQDRTASDPTLSTMVFFGSGKLKTLMIFPKLFSGEHVKYEKHIQVMRGKEITVSFDRPTALQIDGETILGVSSYTARAAVPAKKEEAVAEVAE